MKSLMSAVICLVAACAGLAGPIEANAQGVDLEKFDDPSAKSATTGSTSRIVLEAGDADGRATARVAKALVPPQGADGELVIIPRFALTLSAPFDSKKADKVDVGSLSGLTAGTTGTLDVSFLFYRDPTNAEDNELVKVCNDLLDALLVDHEWSDVSDAGFSCDHRLFTADRLKEVVKELNKRRTECRKCVDSSGEKPSRCALVSLAVRQACADDKNNTSPASLCTLARAERTEACAQCDKMAASCKRLDSKGEAALVNDAQKILDANRKRIARVDRNSFPGQHGFNASFKANREDFKYVLADAPTADPTTAEKQGYGVSLAYSHLGENSLWAGGYSHERTYKAGKKTTLCNPLGSTGSTTCNEASIGAPKLEKAELAFVENRVLISKGKFALAPRGEYDFKTSDWGVRVPFYFIPSVKPKDALTGGVAVGYTRSDDEDKDGWGITVFVSKAFSFLD